MNPNGRVQLSGRPLPINPHAEEKQQRADWEHVDRAIRHLCVLERDPVAACWVDHLRRFPALPMAVLGQLHATQP